MNGPGALNRRSRWILAAAAVAVLITTGWYLLPRGHDLTVEFEFTSGRESLCVGEADYGRSWITEVGLESSTGELLSTQPPGEPDLIGTGCSFTVIFEDVADSPTYTVTVEGYIEDEVSLTREELEAQDWTVVLGRDRG